MGDTTFKPIVTRKLIALLIRKGFINKKGTKHGKYAREGDGHKVMVPRHSKLTPGLSTAMAKELIEKHGFSREEIKELF